MAVIPAAHAQDEQAENAEQSISSGDRSLLDVNEYNFLVGPYYNQMAQTLYKNRPIAFDYNGLRTYYSQTRHYDPLGDDTQRKMLNFAYKIQIEKDPVKIQTALDQYTQLVIDHLANMRIVLQAQALARQDKRFGDVRFFEQVHAGLLRSVMISGDGSNLSDAYDVITPEEEVALLRALKIKVIQTHYRHSGILYYNMHDYIDEKQRAARTIFVNVTAPMKWLDLKNQDTSRAYNIRKR